MERVLSPEERIRRAEQILELRRNAKSTYGNNNLYNKRERIEKENETNGNIAIKRMIKQIIICVAIYTVFFIIKNQNFIFSEEFLIKTKEILSYDVDFIELYNNGITFLQNNYSGDNSEEKEEKTEEKVKSKEETKKNKEDSKQKNNKKEVSQMEKDARYINKKYSLKKPISGIISSEFGEREKTNPVVTKEHKGIDIAANQGTKIVATMDGVVDIATTSSSYGKYIQIVNGDVKTLYAHCNKLCVKEGDKIKAGQKIAEVGSTGNSTRTTFTF